MVRSTEMSAKKRTPSKAPAPFPATTIQNCTFTVTAANWDPKQIDAIQTVARALLNLTEVFKSQGVTAPMISIGSDGTLK